MREDVVNGKCYCGTPRCIGTLFPRIIRDEESGDEGGNEGEVGNAGDGIEEKNEKEGKQDNGIEERGGDIGDGDDMDMDLEVVLAPDGFDTP